LSTPLSPHPLGSAYMNIIGGFCAIQLNGCKNFKNQVEFVQNDIIGHIVNATSSDWQVIEMLGKTQISPEKLIQEEC
jgi:hypothetical protein